MKRKLWLTYAWVDNNRDDVDFVRQEIESDDIEVLMDRYQIIAGFQLWPQIDKKIITPSQSDGWAIYVTENSLRSNPCREELSYALRRALEERSENYPIIGIFPAPVDPELIPSVIATRLYVQLTDANWTERVRSAVLGTTPVITKTPVAPYVIEIYPSENGVTIEIRPRAGVWNDFAFGVPIAEHDGSEIRMLPGSAGSLPSAGMVFKKGHIEANGWHLERTGEQLTPIRSMYVTLNGLPSRICFGSELNGPFKLHSVNTTSL